MSESYLSYASLHRIFDHLTKLLGYHLAIYITLKLIQMVTIIASMQ